MIAMLHRMTTIATLSLGTVDVETQGLECVLFRSESMQLLLIELKFFTSAIHLRHVDIASLHKHGRSAFLAWLSQLELLESVRMGALMSDMLECFP